MIHSLNDPVKDDENHNDTEKTQEHTQEYYTFYKNVKGKDRDYYENDKNYDNDDDDDDKDDVRKSLEISTLA